MHYQRLQFLFFAALLIFFTALPAAQAQTPVTCSATALIDAVTAANANADADTLELQANCTYTFTSGDTTNSDSALPRITTPITINGNNATLTRSSGDNFRLLYVSPGGNLTLNDIMVRDGYVFGNGGALFVENSTVTINDSTFASNYTDGNGGAIAIGSNSVAAITNSILDSNTAFNRAGSIYSNGTLTIKDSVISNNTSVTNLGGGIYSENLPAKLTLIQSTISGNTAAYGGGIGIENGTILNSIISDNSATQSGGGVYADGNPTIVNSLITGNTAVNEGGGVAVYDTMTLVNTTIAGNTSGTAAGIYNFSATTTTTVSNSIVWGNTSGQMQGSGTFNVSYSIVEDGYSGATNSGDDPEFVDAAFGNYQLKSTSPAINAGDTSLLPADSEDLDGDGNTTEKTPYDLDGSPRISDGIVDRGAYEHAVLSSFVISTAQVVAVEGGQEGTYTLALASEPTDTVTVTMTSVNGQVSASSPLLFDSSNWDTPQTVTVTAVDDTDVEGTHGDTLTHTASSNDGTFNGVSASLTAFIRDNDEATTGNLLTNGDFELYDNTTNQPSSWTVKKISGDRTLCNGTTTVTPFGSCAYRFQGVTGEASQLIQNVALSAEMGNTLNLSLYYRTNSVAPRLIVKVSVFYSDSYTQTFSRKITSKATSTAYTLFALNPYTVASGHGEVTHVKVLLQNKQTSGKLFVDDITLTRDYLLPRSAQDGFPALPPSN